MHFKRLRLQGFKSFVEPTDLVISEGLTGIVGPNGCGKSNLVEALRWVMGETSPKRMRGSEMDDVIFAGTTTRPSRNLAEVQLVLDNTERTASAEYNDADELMVMRQIERDCGSDYRINGKPVRQRDVQLLFADHSTGAHSTSVVGQGQIDALIRAKPQERRQILEEASGTAGLQSRRHEAELKLKGAETNLTRVDDVLHTHDAQLRSLKQQVKQASRYRNLAEHIRNTEAVLLRLKWSEAEQTSTLAKEAFAEAEKLVNDLMIVVTQGTTARTESAAELPDLRQAEATAAAIVQKLVLSREQNEAEARRIASETKTHEQLIAQTQGDLSREQDRLKDGVEALNKLADEQTQLTTSLEELIASLPTVLESLEAMSAKTAELDAELHQKMESAANTEAKQKAFLQEIASLTQRQTTLSERRQDLDTQRATLLEEMASRPDLSLASAMVGACESELAKRQEQAQQAEQARGDAERVLSEKRDAAQATATQHARLNAEADAIRGLLQNDDTDGTNEAVIDLITVTPGLENALAIALGEALTATLDSKTAQYWREMPPMTAAAPLPSPATQLSDYVQAPVALARCLTQIGLVDNAQQGEEAASMLEPGQVLVSRDGWAWRWDGFTVTPEAKTSTAIRLQQRNRLAALQNEIEESTLAVFTAQTELDSALLAFTACQELDQLTRVALQAAFAALNDARTLYTQQEREATAANTKLETLDTALAQINADLAEIGERMGAVNQDLSQLPNVDELRQDIAARRTVLAEHREQVAIKQNRRDNLTRDQQRLNNRMNAIGAEKTAWQDRMTSASSQISTLEERQQSLTASLEELKAKPALLETTHAQILDELSVAEAKRKEAADILIAAECKLTEIERQLKQDENALSTARENRVRTEGAVQASDEHFVVLQERIAEKLSCTPDQLPPLEPVAEGETAPTIFELEQTLVKYNRERDNMGPVNLRAEVESETLQTEIDRLTKEKEDLVAAIAKLRQGISQLNREARERLQAAFTTVNERFQELFKKLFDGGKAHLELIDNEDPMNAGLEIFAAPPGKKPQVLSLLSGGERTMTALALLFAVFQTNPSPICVLDEAEAALDEKNINRFCDLVETIARETKTRFLIITHQRLTMARMDRLFGVTMGEKGVSQLVSVDLGAAIAMRNGAPVHAVADAAEALSAVQAA